MALDLNNNKGTYVAATWKDDTSNPTPITPERLNHMEQGIQANSQDIKTIGDSISHIESGTLKFTNLTANATTTGHITFSKSFNEIPNVVATMVSGAAAATAIKSCITVYNITTDGADLKYGNTGTTTWADGYVCWVAVGE